VFAASRPTCHVTAPNRKQLRHGEHLSEVVSIQAKLDNLKVIAKARRIPQQSITPVIPDQTEVVYSITVTDCTCPRPVVLIAIQTPANLSL